MSSEERSPLSGEIDVVIPTRNRCVRVDRLLTTLRSQPGPRHIIVVDDGSTDETPDALASHAKGDDRIVVVRRDEGRGVADARQVGAQAADSAVILFLDDDVVPGPDLVVRHLSWHDASPDRRRVVIGYMPTTISAVWTKDTFVTALYAEEYEGRCRRYEADPTGILRNLWMGNVSISRDLFLDVTARWPEPLSRGRHEDQHVGLRLLAVGATAVFDRSLLAVHEHCRTLKDFRRESWAAGVGHFAIERSHPGALAASGARRYREGLPPSARAVVAVSALPVMYRFGASTLAVVARESGRARRFRFQTVAARLLRRIEQQQGYLSQARAMSAAAIGDD